MALREILLRRDLEADDPGVEGNTRLTASTGILLTALLLVEGFTVLDVRGYLTLHAFVGLMLIGPVVLKTATTAYRMLRYYTNKPAYVRRGPPHMILRLLGPVVVVGSLVVIGSGVMLLVDKGDSDFWLNVHQASFVVWLIATGIHFLGHLYEAVRGTARELRPDSPTRGRAVRMLALAASLAVGIGVAAAFTPSASYWHLRDHEHGQVENGAPPP